MISDLMDNVESEHFRNHMAALQRQFERSLQGQLSDRTIRRHATVVSALIDYLCCDCGIYSFPAIRQGMVCSRFRQWYCSNLQDRTETQVNTAVKKFWLFRNWRGGPLPLVYPQ